MTSPKPCVDLNLKHGFTPPYRPQTNSKAARFIQSALLERRTALSTRAPPSVPIGPTPGFITANDTALIRAHQGICGVAPMAGLKTSCNNLFTLHN
jgi:transposase InsO family protein